MAPEDEIKRKLAADRLDDAFRELFANLLRLARSRQGGAMHELWHQFNAVANAMLDYQKVDQFMPVETIRDALDFSDHAWWERYRDGPPPDRFRESHIETILSGAAQVMASRLLGQKTQEAAGHHEIFEGLREWQEVRGQRK